MCGRCYEEVDELFPAPCEEKPERLKGAPLGQYHCPDCGAMVMAGLRHPDLCKPCATLTHPGFDLPEDARPLVPATQEESDGK
jgi:DNA-directed RNA polymerase subunit RPC12/RpoP